jgi:Putative transmembrane protein (PGPGW)
MESLKRRWNGLPVSIRKPIILVVGLAFVIAAPFTGVLPGPGGIPVFLIGVAILATEYEWAQCIRDPIVRRVEQAADIWRQHKIVGTLAIITVASLSLTASYLLYSSIKA